MYSRKANRPAPQLYKEKLEKPIFTEKKRRSKMEIHVPQKETTAPRMHCRKVIKPKPTTPCVKMRITSATQRAQRVGTEIKRLQRKA